MMACWVSCLSLEYCSFIFILFSFSNREDDLERDSDLRAIEESDERDYCASDGIADDESSSDLDFPEDDEEDLW